MHDKMQIWIQPRGWQGCIVVVALNERDARSMMEAEINYSPEAPLRSFDFEPGYKYCNTGDL